MISSRIFVFVSILASAITAPSQPAPTSEPASPCDHSGPAPGPGSGPAPGPGHGPVPGPAQSPSPGSTSADATNEDYYLLTATPQDLTKILPQDNKDAKNIKDALLSGGDLKQQEIASVLAYRDPARRIVINKILARDGHPLINCTYVPQGTEDSLFYDICFAMVNEEAVVTSTTLGNAMINKDETWTTITMILTKDMKGMITVYDSEYETTFEHDRKDQRHPYQNMLRVWASRSRDQDESGPPNSECVTKDVNILLEEQGKWNDKWGNKRDQLELILMAKSIKYARAVIAEFEKQRKNVAIETIIKDTIKNKDLADAYSSLASYVKNRHQYIADLLHKYSDGSDAFTAWQLALGTVRPVEWPKINECYKAGGNKNLSHDIGNCDDFRFDIFHEMIAVAIDPSYKPVMFNSKTAETKKAPQEET